MVDLDQRPSLGDALQRCVMRSMNKGLYWLEEPIAYGESRGARRALARELKTPIQLQFLRSARMYKPLR